MATSPKTIKVTFKDGTEGRAIKVTARNYITVMNWGGFEAREHINAKGIRSKERVYLHHNGTKAVRVAVPGDYVVKTTAGFQVVKADKAQILKGV